MVDLGLPEHREEEQQVEEVVPQEEEGEHHEEVQEHQAEAVELQGLEQQEEVEYQQVVAHLHLHHYSCTAPAPALQTQEEYYEAVAGGHSQFRQSDEATFEWVSFLLP